MSFLGGSSTGEIRYAVIVDDSQASGKINNFMNSLNKMNAPTQQLNNNMNTLNKTITTSTTDMSRLSSTFNAGVNKIQSAGPPLANLEKSVKSTSSSFQKFGSFAKENVANVAILASGIAMLDDSYLALHKAQVANDRAHLMVQKSQQQVSKTQEGLNKLVREGKIGTTEYALKSNDLRLAQEKLDVTQQRAEVSQENLNERTEDFWNSLIPNALIVGGSAFNMIKSLGITTENFSGAMGKLSGSLVTTTGGLSNFGILMAGGLGIAGAIALIQAVNMQVEKFYKTVQAKPRQNATIIDAIFDWKGFVQKSKEGEAEVDEILSRTGASLAEFALAPERVGQKFLDMGGKIDASGKIALTAKDHFFDLELGLNGIGKSSIQYIYWTEKMIEQQKGQKEIMDWLVNITGLKLPVAQNIYNKAVKDAAPLLAEMSKQLGDVGLNWVTGKKQIDDYISSQTQLTKVSEDYIRTEHEGSSQLEASLTKRKEFTDGLDKENESLLATAKSLGLGTIELGKYTKSNRDNTITLQEKNNALSSVITKIEELKNSYKNLHPEISKNTQDINAWYSTLLRTASGSGPILETINKVLGDFKDNQPLMEAKIQASNKALADQTKELEDWKNAIDAANAKLQELRNAPTIHSALKIETNKDKMMKKLLKSLPDHIEKDITAEIKFEDNKEAARANFMELLQKGIDAGESDVDYDKIVKNIITNIDKNFPNDPVMQNMKRELANAIGGDDTEKKVQEMLQLWNLTVPVTGTIDPKLVFSGGGFNFDIDNPKTTKKSKVKKNVALTNIPGDTGGTRYGTPLNEKNPFKKWDSKGNLWIWNFETGKWDKAETESGIDERLNQPYTGAPFTYQPVSSSKQTPTDPVNQAQILQKALQSLTTYGIKNLAALAKAATTDFNTVANYAKGATTIGIQPLQVAINSLKTYAITNMMAMGKAAKTNFNTVANYANGAVIAGIQPLQVAINSLSVYGRKNIAALAKSSKTDFNTVANYSAGAMENGIQPLQTSIDSLKKYGVKNLDALAKNSKTNFNTIANYADGATSALKDLAKAFIAVAAAAKKARNAAGGGGGGLDFGAAQHGMHTTLERDRLILAHKGEKVDIGQPSSNQNATQSGSIGGSGGSGGYIIINLTNVNSDRETVRTYRRELGKDIYRFGPT